MKKKETSRGRRQFTENAPCSLLILLKKKEGVSSNHALN